MNNLILEQEIESTEMKEEIVFNSIKNYSYFQEIESKIKYIAIGEGAFRKCFSLTQFTIPSSVTSIGLNTFRECYGLIQITIPLSVTSIGSK